MGMATRVMQAELRLLIGLIYGLNASALALLPRARQREGASACPAQGDLADSKFPQ